MRFYYEPKQTRQKVTNKYYRLYMPDYIDSVIHDHEQRLDDSNEVSCKTTEEAERVLATQGKRKTNEELAREVARDCALTYQDYDPEESNYPLILSALNIATQQQKCLCVCCTESLCHCLDHPKEERCDCQFCVLTMRALLSESKLRDREDQWLFSLEIQRFMIDNAALMRPGEIMMDTIKRWAKKSQQQEAELEAVYRKSGICSTCKEPFEHDVNEPFAYCKCGTSEWPFADVAKEPLAIQLSVAEAELERLRDNRIEQEGAIGELKSELEKLREDKEALDWLENKRPEISRVGGSLWSVNWNSPISTLRFAIANAIKDEKKV